MAERGQPSPGSTASNHPRRMRTVGELFQSTWTSYKERVELLSLLPLFTLVVLVNVLGALVLAGYAVTTHAPEKLPRLIAVGSIVGAFAAIVVLSWGFMASLIAVVDPVVDMKEALARAWKKAGALIWFLSIAGFIITGGFFMLVVPGVLFTVWFAFGQYILAEDGVGGVKALLRSRAYVKGRGAAVFGRLLLIWLLAVVLGIVPLLGPVLSFFFTPFLMLYTYNIYRDLKSVKREISFPSSLGARAGWIALGAAGYAVPPLIIIAVIAAFMGSGALGSIKAMLTPAGISQLLSAQRSVKDGGAPSFHSRGSLRPQQDGKPEAAGEAVIVKDGARETYVLKTGFFSDTRFKDPAKATVQFQFPAPEEHSNARRIEITLDATKEGKHYADGKAIFDSMFNNVPVDVGASTPRGYAAVFRFVADGGQVFPPKEGCTIIVTRAYQGVESGRFEGELSDCVVHSAGIDYTIQSVEFTMKGVPSR